MDFRFQCKGGRAADIAPMAEVDPELTLAPRAQRVDSEQFRSASRTLLRRFDIVTVGEDTAS